MKHSQLSETWAEHLVNTVGRRRDMWLGFCNVRSVYRSGPVTAVGREVVRCRLCIVGVQEVRWVK